MVLLYPESLIMANQLSPANMKPAQLLLLLLFQSQVSQTSSTPQIVNGALGESVMLPLKFSAEKRIMSIIWLHNGISIAFTQLEGQSSLTYITDPKWKNRLSVTDSYSLQISNLTMADAGSYSTHITTMTSSVVSTYDLRIFKRLPRPQVQVDSLSCEHSTCIVTLRCSVEEGGENIIYEWTKTGPRTVLTQEGSVLSDSCNWNYTCTATNPVGNSTSSLNLVQQLCAGSKATTGTFSPVTWILLGKGLLLVSWGF
ncbi:SLAM family member 6 [Camelus dromedarius]|uniref:SLAM family member 6 n=1 Tax=Camelus dromedarius TaxID=9838 RepID=UPI0031194B52